MTNGAARSSALPRCMDMITAEEVIRRIEGCFAGGARRFLTEEEARVCASAGVASKEYVMKDGDVVEFRFNV